MIDVQANFRPPAGITEDDLVDLVDGRLSREREAKVVAAVSADAGLRAMVGAMRSDRVVLGQLAEMRAPAGLADAIEARLQAEALRDLASASREAPAPIPISSVRIKRPSVLPALLESVWTRRLAMAASIALIAGGAAWGVRELVRRNGNAPGSTEVVHAKPSRTEPILPPVAPEPAPVDVAVVNNNETIDTGPMPALAMEPNQPMTEARAAELARAGRLIITVHAPGGAASAVKKLDTLAKAGVREGWRTIGMDRVPAELASLTMPAMPISLPGTVKTGDRAVASDQPGASAPKTSVTPGVRAVVKAIYTAEVNPGDRWLGGLIQTVTDALPEGAVLQLREGPSIAPAGAAVDPESVLWWNGQPGKWAKKATVPIVVEGLE